jgi:hypothetical protein
LLGTDGIALAADCLAEKDVEDPLEYCEAEAPQIVIRANTQQEFVPLRNFKLQQAAQGGDVTAMRMLLLQRAHVDARRPLAIPPGSPSAQRDAGLTALMYAAQSGYDQACAVLLKARASVNGEEEDGFRPLHFAAQAGSLEACRVLLRYRADPQARNDDGQAALDLVPPSELAVKADKLRWLSALGSAAVVSPRRVPTPCTALDGERSGKGSRQLQMRMRGRSHESDGRSQVWV